MGKLVVTRKVGESIVIGEDVVVTVLSDKDGKHRIQIDAPDQISVHRKEVFERIQSGAEFHGEGRVGFISKGGLTA